jgi:hypothetical protein
VFLSVPYKDSSLIKLPPCEATFKQHELRTSLQTKIWMNAHEARAVGQKNASITTICNTLFSKKQIY